MTQSILSNQHSKRKHSDFAASSSHRWLNCPASVELSKKAPPKEENKYTLEGTTAHECLEFIVRRWGAKDKGMADALKKWPKEMVAHALDSAKTIFKLKPSPTAKLLIETRVILKHINKGLFGTLDYAWVDEWGELVIIDFKYGAGVPVLPFDEETNEPNSQLMYYASGIAALYNYEFSHIKLAIIQPRVWRENEDPLTEGKTTIKALREFEKKVKAAFVQAKQPGLKPTPPPEGSVGENWCRWCPAASFCPAISKVQMDNLGIEFSVEEGVDKAKLPEITALTPNTIGKFLDACDLLEVWIGGVRMAAFQMAVAGHKVTGRKLVSKTSKRFWLDNAAVEAKKRFGEKAFKTELLSPAQLEKTIGKEAKSFTEKFADNKSSGYSLVPMSNKRPEVDVKAIDILVEENED